MKNGPMQFASAIFLNLLIAASGLNAAEESISGQGGDKDLHIDLGDGVGIVLVPVQPGSFTMGEDQGDPDEKPVHKVTLTKPYYLGKVSVTEEQWRSVMGTPGRRHAEKTHPVVNVSWDRCVAFAAKLSQKFPRYKFTLPTEAQWEYACRGGHAANTQAKQIPLSEFAWFDSNSDCIVHPVGLKKPNALGLHDVLGNIWEWCADWYGPYPAEAVVDPTGPSAGAVHVVKGGAFNTKEEKLRFSRRRSEHALTSLSTIGFRLCCTKAE